MTQTRPEESPDMTTGSGLLYPMMYFCTWIQHGSLHLGAERRSRLEYIQLQSLNCGT